MVGIALWEHSACDYVEKWLIIQCVREKNSFPIKAAEKNIHHVFSLSDRS